MTNLRNKIIQEYKVIKDISKDLHIFEISRSDYGKLSQTITMLVDRKYISKHFADNKLCYRKNSTFDYFPEQYLAEINEPTIDKDYALIYKIKQLIQEGQALPEEKINTGVSLRCSAPEFIKWLSKIKIFNETMLKKHPLYNNIDTICFQKMKTGYDEMMGILQALFEEFSGENMENQEKLQIIINEIDNIITVYEGEESAEFKTWHRRTLKFLSNLFGEKSDEAIDFKETSYSPSVLSLDDDIDGEYYNSYMATLKNIKTTLQSYMDDAIEKDNENTQIVIKDDKIGTYIETEVNKKSNNKVFIVHGHDDLMLSETENLICKLELEPIILKNQANGGLSTIIEKFEDSSDVSFAIVLFTSDDIGYKKGDDKNAKTRARQNVVFELGYFAGKLGRKNVSIINNGVEELPSDIQGVVYTPNEAGWKYKIADELKKAGLNVDMNKI